MFAPAELSVQSPAEMLRDRQAVVNPLSADQQTLTDLRRDVFV